MMDLVASSVAFIYQNRISFIFTLVFFSYSVAKIIFYADHSFSFIFFYSLCIFFCTAQLHSRLELYLKPEWFAQNQNRMHNIRIVLDNSFCSFVCSLNHVNFVGLNIWWGLRCCCKREEHEIIMGVSFIRCENTADASINWIVVRNS